MPDDCPFCSIDRDRLIWEGDRVFVIWDAFPVAKGHALVIPKRHVDSWFLATEEERSALACATDRARQAIERDYHPDGYSIGINDGRAAGQTIPHLHVHVIPRYEGDVVQPRGGVRGIIPDQADYLADNRALLVPGPPDPLLPHLHVEIDRSVHVDIAVAFVYPSGIDHMYEHFVDLLERGGTLRLLTGDYLTATDPIALRRLLDLHIEHAAQVELRVYETQPPISFHPKSYLFRRLDGSGTAFVGSSNLTNTALQSGVEWNYRVVSARDRLGFQQTVEAFEALFHDAATVQLTNTWVDAYERRRRPSVVPPPPPPDLLELPEPHQIQVEALKALRQTRSDGNNAGLVVLATGLGKTWLSAFDSVEFDRVLFVAHREEILNQALRTFRKIRPAVKLGFYNGQEKVPTADVLFASIQTLGRLTHLTNFNRQAFDYIVVDEFHHAAAPTYRRLIEYFEPEFLLGLTATPDRTDGQDLLGLCGDNLVYRRDLIEGIEEGLLSTFRYFGVPDEVDYETIPWRSSRFDEEALTNAVATQARAENALEQYRNRAGSRTLAFCCSMRHADFMREYFRNAGERVAAVHSGDTTDPRASSLEQLNDGDLDAIFAVDMFNEGVDLPNVDTIMMLRPTESSILWLQQFGRGLRVAENKPFLTVIDYIGNHRTFLIKPRTLLGLGPGDGEIEHALNALQQGNAELPPGCEVTYELEAVDIIRSLLKPSRGTEAVRAFYEDFRQRHGVRPTAAEVYRAGYDPRSLRSQFGSWHRFVATMGDLDTPGRNLLEGSSGRFLTELERTPMTKSYKMTLLEAMLNRDAFPGSAEISPLTAEFVKVMEHTPALRHEAGDQLETEDSARRLLERYPIPAWTGGAGTGRTSYFEYKQGSFQTRINITALHRPRFQELVRELVAWRLAEYTDRQSTSTAAEDGIVCRVGGSGGRVRLELPDRSEKSGIPFGWKPVEVDDTQYQADFRQDDITRIRNPETEENVLPRLLRRWFGPDVGRPGTTHRVVFRAVADGTLVLDPLGVDGELKKELWQTYSREQIPALFGFEFNTGLWRQGFILKDETIVLLVTLDKGSMAEDHKYQDRFVGPSVFHWQSQNRTKQASNHGQSIRNHARQGIPVHLFVRPNGKEGGKAAPFVYCGELEFQRWEGEQPITVWWQMKTPVPDRWWEAFRVPREDT